MDNLIVSRPSEEGIEPSTTRPSRISPTYEYVDANVPDTSADGFRYWLQYWNILWRHKIVVLATTVSGVLLALAVTLHQAPLFVSRATLEIQQGSSQPFEGISFLNNFDPNLVQTQAQLLMSGQLQERVYSKVLKNTPSNGISVPDSLLPLRRRLGLLSFKNSPTWREAVSGARSNLDISLVKDSSIVHITSWSTVPQAAADYVNSLVDEFVQQNIEERWALYETTGAWLTRAQEDLKTKLEKSEKDLIAYASVSGLVVTSNNEMIGEQKLVQLQTELSKAQADRIAKESVYRTASAQSPEALAQVLDQGPMAQYEMKLVDLRRELAEATTSLTPAHPKVRRLQAQIDELESANSQERNNILNRLRTDYESALQRERQLLTDFTSESKALSNQDQKLIRYKTLQREVETYRKLYETTLQRGKEASVASALRPISVRLVDSAGVPKFPARPILWQNLAYGLLGGLVVGAAFVLLRDRTDLSIRMPGSIASDFNLRELGVIPSAKADLKLSGWKRQRSLPAGFTSSARQSAIQKAHVVEPVELTTWDRKASMVAESFRATLASLLLSGENGHRRQVILVTSPSPREGKSTVVTNLGIALAEINRRVLIIDADLRRPRIHTIFDQANTWGLSDLLREKTACAAYPTEGLARKTHVPGLFSLPSGPAAVSASQLLYMDRMAELVERLRNDFDAVLIDTPPVLSVPDARVLSRLVDGVVLVFRAGRTTRESATLAVSMLEADGGVMLGTVLNDWNPRNTVGYGYESVYRTYYGGVASSL
jgi:capsular exopolysaccharide synthesis family protein